MKCKDCKWWDRKLIDNCPKDKGVCRRKSPNICLGQIYPNESSKLGFPVNHSATWPLTRKDDFCGEFEKN